MPRVSEHYLNFELWAECEKFILTFQLVTQNDLIDIQIKIIPLFHITSLIKFMLKIWINFI